MSETKGKKKFDLPSAEKVQNELSKAESMDDFFGKDGIKNDGIMPHMNCEIVIVFTARVERFTDPAIDQPLEMRHAIWYLPLQYAHHAFF